MYEAYCTYVDDKYYDNHDYDDDTDADTDNDTGYDTDDDDNDDDIDDDDNGDDHNDIGATPFKVGANESSQENKNGFNNQPQF